MRKPDFFLVGAPKCGTTSMTDYLARHPEIFIPNGKEFHFFGSDLMRKRYRFREDEYLSLFAAVRDDQIIGECSVYYLYSHRAAREIHDFEPDAKILIMLRNPTDMIYSCHFHLRFGGLEEIEDFERALDAQAERAEAAARLREHPDPKEPGDLDPLLYRDLGLYSDQVSRYFDVFGQEQVHVIIFDDFVEDTAAVFRETLEFLGVDPAFQTEFDILNAAKTARSRILQRLTSRPPAFARRLARAFIPPLIRHRVLMGGLIRLNARAGPNPPMDPALREELQAHFAPDVERLSGLLGRDLTHWSEPRGAVEAGPGRDPAGDRGAGAGGSSCTSGTRPAHR